VIGRAANARTLLASLREAQPHRPSFAQVAPTACALALFSAAGLHIALGLEHAGSLFGNLSVAAGMAQGALATEILRRSSGALALHAVVLLDLVLIQLYLLNVTVGLPPAIAHSHISGEREVWLITLAWPGDVDWRGVSVTAAQIASAACAAWLRRLDRSR
jgi:hypothetical protein